MLVEQIHEQAAVAAAIGLTLSPLVYAAVSALRGMIGAHRRRRLILPLAGVLCGWTFVGLALAAVGAEPSVRAAALALLGGFEAFVISAGLSAQGKEARR